MGCFFSNSVDDTERVSNSFKSAGGIRANSDFDEIPNIWQVLKFKKNIGAGASAQVCLVESCETKIEYALKMMAHKHHQMFLKELTMLKRLDCPQIVRFQKAYRDQQNDYILMEYCSGDTLIQRIANRRKYTEGIASQTAKMMLQALRYLHHKDIVHRDIKPENFVYLTEKDAGLKLLDFGIAMDVIPNEKYSFRAGTPYYMAPEVIRNREPRSGDGCKKIDMWSVGVCIFIMLNGQAPFKGSSKDALFDNILFQKKIKFTTRGISKEAKDLVFKLLQRDPELRLTVDQALEHPWIVKCGMKENEIMASTVEALRFFNAKYSVHRALQQVAAANMDKHDDAHYKKLFDQFDLNGDGNITKEECVKALELNMMYPKEAEKMAEEMIKSTDDNNDNMIQYNEFKNAIARHGLSQDQYKMHAIFSALDANRDGFISIAEFSSCLPQGDDKEIAEIIEAFKEADENKDDRLSFDEFTKILYVSPERKTSAFKALQPQEMDEVMDDNERYSQFKSGVIPIENAQLDVFDAHDKQIIGDVTS